MLQILLENHQTQQHLQKFDPNHWVSLAGFVKTFQGLPRDWFSGWPHLQTLQLLGVGHLFWGSFVAMFLGWKMLIIRKVLDPEHFIRMTNIWKKEWHLTHFGIAPGKFYKLSSWFIYENQGIGPAGAANCTCQVIHGKHSPEMHLFASHTTLQVESLACI